MKGINGLEIHSKVTIPLSDDFNDIPGCFDYYTSSVPCGTRADFTIKVNSAKITEDKRQNDRGYESANRAGAYILSATIKQSEFGSLEAV